MELMKLYEEQVFRRWPITCELGIMKSYVLSYPATLGVQFYEINIACEMGLMKFYELP